MSFCVNKQHKNDSVISQDFQDSNIFHPLFGLESKRMLLCDFFVKHDSFAHCCLTHIFNDAFFLENTLNVTAGHTIYFLSTTCRLIFKKTSPEAAKSSMLEKHMLVTGFKIVILKSVTKTFFFG